MTKTTSPLFTDAITTSLQELGNLLWGLGRTGATPSPQVLELAEGAALELLPRGSPQNVVNILYGMARMRHMAGDAFLSAAAQRLKDMCVAEEVGAAERDESS